MRRHARSAGWRPGRSLPAVLALAAAFAVHELQVQNGWSPSVTRVSALLAFACAATLVYRAAVRRIERNPIDR